MSGGLSPFRGRVAACYARGIITREGQASNDGTCAHYSEAVKASGRINARVGLVRSTGSAIARAQVRGPNSIRSSEVGLGPTALFRPFHGLWIRIDRGPGVPKGHRLAKF